jgi:hypothetical protein
MEQLSVNEYLSSALYADNQAFWRDQKDLDNEAPAFTKEIFHTFENSVHVFILPHEIS